MIAQNDFSRERLALIVDTSVSGLRVAREFDQLIAWRGRPAIVSGNGTELTPNAIRGSRSCSVKV